MSNAAGAGGVLTRSQNRRVDHEPQPTTVDVVEDSQDEDYVPGMFLLILCLRVGSNELCRGWAGRMPNLQSTDEERSGVSPS